MNPMRVLTLALGLVATALVVGLGGSLVESIDATEVMVIQDWYDGELHWHTDPGIKVQMFGKVTKYPRRAQYWFSSKPDQGVKEDQSIQIRYNDGGHAKISGSISWDFPSDPKLRSQLHSQYGAYHNVEQQLVRTVIEKAVYMSGPLMSSKESYAERRTELIRLIEEQTNNGVLQTRTEEKKEPDPITGQMKTVNVVRVLTDKDGKYLRQEASPLLTYGIKTSNLSINEIKYDPEVEKQIQSQQQMTMQVQTAKAEALKAEQAVITAQKTGEADAAKAKWAQEAIKAKLVTEAEQKLAVAKLDRESAEQEKAATLLRAQGEAEGRRLKMAADGALDARLEAMKEINKHWADAFQNSKVPIVPNVVFVGGQGDKGAPNNFLGLMEMIQANVAMDISKKVGTPAPLADDPATKQPRAAAAK